MAKATCRVVGADLLKAELKLFPERVQTAAIESGVRKGAGILRTAMRRQAYQGPAKTPAGFTRTLRKALRSAVGKRRGKNAGKAWVGLKKVKGEARARNYYRVLEFGRKPYKTKSGAAYAGSPPMRPFFEKAWNDKREEVSQAIITGTRVALAKEAGKVWGRTRAASR